MPCTAPGTYYVTIKTWSKTVASLVDEAVVEVIIPRYDAIDYSVVTNEWDDHTIIIKNEGNVARDLGIEYSYSKPSWEIVQHSATSGITLRLTSDWISPLNNWFMMTAS